MQPSLILFDIDGTLIATNGAGRRAIGTAFQRVFDVPPAAFDGARVPFAGKSDLEIFASLGRAVAVEAPDFERGWEELRQAYLRALAGEMSSPDGKRMALPGVPTLLETLAARSDARLGLITGNLEEGARTKLEPFDLNRYFPGGGFGSDHGSRRQIARIARERMIELTGIPFEPERVVVIGDTENDVDCARANGFRAVAVRTGWAEPGGLEAARPDALLEDLSDLDVSLDALGLGHGA